MVDVILAIAHHLAVFGLVALFAAEVALLRPGIEGRRLAQLGAIDGAYGAVAGIVIVVGILRIVFGASGAGYYFANWIFWTKMVAFLLVGLLSIGPTVAVIGWRKEAKASPGFAPKADAIATARRFLVGEAVLLVFIPAFAAAMARGYGV